METETVPLIQTSVSHGGREDFLKQDGTDLRSLWLQTVVLVGKLILQINMPSCKSTHFASSHFLIAQNKIQNWWHFNRKIRNVRMLCAWIVNVIYNCENFLLQGKNVDACEMTLSLSGYIFCIRNSIAAVKNTKWFHYKTFAAMHLRACNLTALQSIN